MGSSPRGRGKRGEAGRDDPRAGLIPAWAGKTVLDNAEYFTAWAHPRVGGENISSRDSGMSSKGSSPRGRGKLDRAGNRLAIQRLIPAWAGKTGSVARSCGVRRAHPRVGGENCFAISKTGCVPGSSPRGRGKPWELGHKGSAAGLIPAWAGKTDVAVVARAGDGAHPRVGGENADRRFWRCWSPGSSPRGRGKPRLAIVSAMSDGLIPAWAGKTRRR